MLKWYKAVCPEDQLEYSLARICARTAVLAPGISGTLTFKTIHYARFFLVLV